MDSRRSSGSTWAMRRVPGTRSGAGYPSRREVAARQFDLSAGAPLYGRVLVLRQTLTSCSWSFIAACDGWSAGLFLPGVR